MDPFIIDKFTREMCCARQRVLARPSFNNTKILAAVHEIWAIFFPATTPSIVLFMALQALLVDPQCECVWPRLRNVFLESSISTREPHSSHWVCEFLAVFQSSCFSQMFGCCGCAFFFPPFLPRETNVCRCCRRRLQESGPWQEYWRHTHTHTDIHAHFISELRLDKCCILLPRYTSSRHLPKQLDDGK